MAEEKAKEEKPPPEGGSYVRKPDGSLDRVEHGGQAPPEAPQSGATGPAKKGK